MSTSKVKVTGDKNGIFTIKINRVIPQNSVRPNVLDHAQNHVSLEQRHKSIITIVLSDHDFLFKNLDNLPEFMVILAIFSLRNAHAQKRLFASLRLKF